MTGSNSIFFQRVRFEKHLRELVQTKGRSFLLVSLFVLHLLLLFFDDHNRYLFHGLLSIGTPLISSKDPLRICESSGGSSLPARFQYAVVLDCGSTGSRAHIYRFRLCGEVLDLDGEFFYKVKPGLSAFKDAPKQSIKTLKPLLNAAKQRVPTELHACTPIVLRATAGLRLLPENVVQEILSSVKLWLTGHGFPLGEYHSEHRQFDPSNAVTVMEGSDEGIMAWITVNFLQGRISHRVLSKEQNDLNRENVEQLSMLAMRTSITIDLGGGSTQLVFAVDPAMKIEYSRYPEYYHKLPVEIGTLFVYQHSFLGYGLMEAKRKVMEHFIASAGPIALAAAEAHIKVSGYAMHVFPCFLPDHKNVLGNGHILQGDEEASWNSCLRIVEQIFDKQAQCKMPPCSFNGIHQPPFPSKSSSIVTFSYLYDRTIPLGMSSPLTPHQIEETGRLLCSPLLNKQYIHHLSSNPEWCLDLVYIYALLTRGYGLGSDHSITVIKEVDGFQAGWCLATALKLLQTTPTTCPAPILQ